MPSKPIDYTNTYFYKIVCKDTSVTDCYVGHTTDFTNRKNSHKTRCFNVNSDKHNIHLYQFIRENGGWENWEMINIETKHCKDSLEAKSIERDFTEKLKATLNIRRPFRTNEERAESKKIGETTTPNTTKHIIKNIKKSITLIPNNTVKTRREWKKKHYEENKADILAKQKEDYENNKEVRLERNIIYRENNKDKIKARACQVINCECGNKYTKQNKNRHLKSKRHQAYLKQQQEN